METGGDWWSLLSQALWQSPGMVSLPALMSLSSQIACKQAMISGPVEATTAVGRPGKQEAKWRQICEAPRVVCTSLAP